MSMKITWDRSNEIRVLIQEILIQLLKRGCNYQEFNEPFLLHLCEYIVVLAEVFQLRSNRPKHKETVVMIESVDV